ncbi:MAG: glycosyl hydrolase [Candidatus Fervidibacter sp.]|uniref:glycosyl hydrolase n=1 Tax=Candidatus Fervidibacter sp. TaxID=3100871 RepID=UPI00404A42BE
MLKKVALGLGVLVLFVLPFENDRFVRSGAIAQSKNEGSTVKGGQNPFGVMLPSQLARSPDGIQVAKKLGAVYFRPSSVFLDQWKGSHPESDVALKSGLKLILTIRNSGPMPTSPPKDHETYKRMLGDVLDKYSPLLLVVENEENSSLFYTGTPEEYGAQLKAACEIAHKKGVACTNGGLVSTLVALLVYDNYLQNGQEKKAQDFASRAFGREIRRKLSSPQAQEQIRKGKALLKAYQDAGVDYVNFHWYIADTRALEEAVAFLRKRTNLPVITNEVGQFTDDPRQTTAVMQKIVELGLPIAVWFGLDGPKARGLVNLDGSLRPTGEAFKRFIERNFNK